MLLPAVTAWSAPAALTRYADCARAMGIAQDGEGEQAAAARLVEALRDVNRHLSVPTPKSYGIDKARWTELLPLMAEQALASGSPGNNPRVRSEEHTSELQSLMRLSYAVFCLKNKTQAPKTIRRNENA